MECNAIIKTICPENHKSSRLCYETTKKACRKCEDEAEAAEKRRKREWELDQARQAKQRAYAAELVALDDEIEHEKRAMKAQAEDKDCHNALAQKKLDLANLKKVRASGLTSSTETNAAPVLPSANHDNNSTSTSLPPSLSNTQSPSSNAANITSSTPATTSNGTLPDWDKSEAKDEWEWQKIYEGAENEALDFLMKMIGLYNWAYVRFKF
jgi:hypothetical protein